jgi:hypothetical protein
MDIIDMARASGMTVILDGKIGQEEYRSVCGSLSALQRFAEAVRHSKRARRAIRSTCDRLSATHEKKLHDAH